MSRWGKRRDEGFPSGDSQRPNKKKAFNSAADDDSDNIIVCEISRNRRVSVRSWQGKVVVDIREFYVKDGKVFPGKKAISLGYLKFLLHNFSRYQAVAKSNAVFAAGISLTMEQWEVLRNHVEEIDEAVNENQ